MTALDIRCVDGGVCFTVKVAAASSRTSVAGVMNGMLKVKIAAIPEKGKANKCLVGFIAALLNLRQNQVRILSGHGSPVKQVQVVGISKEMLQTKIQNAK